MPAVFYDIEADWQLLNTCNYRCGYCFLAPKLLGEKLVEYAEPQAWATAFTATGLTWLLHLTGGEPSIYPKFVDLCEILTARHYLSLNSNLTSPAWADFAKRIDPRRVSFINAGLHYDERRTRQGFTAFSNHLAALIKAEFAVFVSIVATPEVLAAGDLTVAQLDGLGIVPLPKLLQGSYQGRIYPAAYTVRERAAFAAMADKARAANKLRMRQWLENPSIDLRDDDMMLHRVESFTGQSCAAGQKFISVKENGDAFRCSTIQPLGNILAGSLVLKTGPARCDTSYCPYFCRKYTEMVPKAERQSVLFDPQWWRQKARGVKARCRGLVNPPMQ
jgi:MoaA/NifB/PqqE/SkfB family radical SAM enzyme